MITTLKPLGQPRVLPRRRAMAQIGGGALSLAALASCSSSGDAKITVEESLFLGTLIARATQTLPPVRAAAVAYMIGVGALTVVDLVRDYFDDDQANKDEVAIAEFMAKNGLFRNPVDKVWEKSRHIIWTAMQDVEPLDNQEQNGCTALVQDSENVLLLEGQALIALGAVVFTIADQEGLTKDQTNLVAERVFPTNDNGQVNVLLEQGGNESKFKTASGDLVITRVDDGDMTTEAKIEVALPDGEAWNVPVPRLTHV